MGQIPLSFPSVISPLAAADLFQIYSSRTEMRFWSNEHSPVYACRAVKSILSPKACLHPSPSHRTLESDADLPACRCVIPTRNKRFEKAALGMQGAKGGVPWLERAPCWAQPPPGQGCSTTPAPGRPPHRVASQGNGNAAGPAHSWGLWEEKDRRLNRVLVLFYLWLAYLVIVIVHCLQQSETWRLHMGSPALENACLHVCEHPTEITEWFVLEGILKTN